jgi:hypothetical protein
VDGFKMVQFEMIQDFHDLFECLQQGRTKDKTYKKVDEELTFLLFERHLCQVFFIQIKFLGNHVTCLSFLYKNNFLATMSLVCI